MHAHARAVAVLVVGLLIAILPFRREVAQVFGPVLQPLRIAQSWTLYGTGPMIVRRFEVLVDGQLVYRAGDGAYPWRRATFTYRRVRPTVVHTCIGDGKNARHLARWVVAEARAEFPEAQEIVLRCTTTPWPDGEQAVEYLARAAAPEWNVRQQP